MSKLREFIRDESRRRCGLARGPLVVMNTFWEPVLSPTGDRVVGSRTLDTDASAFIVGDSRGRFWQQHGETFETFEKRVKEEADALRQSARQVP